MCVGGGYPGNLCVQGMCILNGERHGKTESNENRLNNIAIIF